MGKIREASGGSFAMRYSFVLLRRIVGEDGCFYRVQGSDRLLCDFM